MTDGAWIGLSIMLLVSACLPAAAQSANGGTADWIARFAFVPPVASESGVCPRGSVELPTFTVKPAARGKQLVRVSLPFAPRAFPVGSGLVVRAGGAEIVPDVRSLTYHPGKPASVRRAMVTFVYDFPDLKERQFTLALKAGVSATAPTAERARSFKAHIGDIDLELTGSAVSAQRAGKELWRAELIAPQRTSTADPKTETIERGPNYTWVRLLVPDAAWPRIIEVRADSLGTVAVRAHLQRLETGDGYAPELGWRLTEARARFLHSGDSDRAIAAEPVKHEFDQGAAAWVDGSAGRISFPDAPLLRRGQVAVAKSGNGLEVTYLRCSPDERVPFQEAAWRTATFAVGPPKAAPLNALLEPTHEVRVPARFFDAVYASGREADLSSQHTLEGLSRYHRDAIVQSALTGDDFGNITGFPAGAFGMNRLNHCTPIFDEYYRSGDARLRATALQWCDNFHDLSIWWGAGREGDFGGTRYNNIQAMGVDDHKGEKSFMWRSNTAVSFCTKGIDSFFFAYEETGDPRMATALRWQFDYSKRMVHAGLNYCRDIGEVADLLRLHKFTGRSEYLDECLRLFGELRACLSDGDLFTESGQPIEKDPPFIDDDKHGLEHPYAKPYIIGYALSGLPDLARIRRDEPKLHDVVRAVADFLATSVDPSGGWRYPHPCSRYIIIS